MASTAIVCWKLADNFAQWWADGAHRRFGNHILSRIEAQPSCRADTVEQITCPSLVEVTPKSLPTTVSPYFSIRTSPKGGMGAFALCDIPKSTIILRELALFLATDGKGHLAEELDKLTVEEREAFSKLACYDLLDADRDIAIFKTNRFRTGSSCGIFLTASRFNHACDQSISYDFDFNSRHLTFITKRDIKMGEELTIMYSPNSYDLSLNYGFLCDCGACDPPEQVPVWRDRWAEMKVTDETDELVRGAGWGETLSRY